MKKYLIGLVGVCSLVSLTVVNAQIAGSPAAAGSAAAGTGVASPGVIASPARPVIVPAPIPIPPPSTGDILQFNNLVVQSVSAAMPPAEMLAVNEFQPLPMMGAAGSATSDAAGVSASANGATCISFDTPSAAAGSKIDCPIPPAASSAFAASGTGSGMTAPANPSQPVPVPPIWRSTYRLEVSANTRLLLKDRTAANLGDFSYGDRINVFGYYNTDGTINALIVRDLSKPAEKQIVQFNNADLISVSGSDLVVVVQPVNPCYGWEQSAGSRAIIPCPMGLQSFSDNPATKNTELPGAYMPIARALGKYDVKTDAQTVLLDRDRGGISFSDLKAGDKLNIYGETDGSGIVTADIVRDLSLPVAAQDVQGTVTQVNSDGSFVIQTPAGETITVENPIKAGIAVELQGVLDNLAKTLSQVSQIVIQERAPAPAPPTSAPTELHCGGFILNAKACPPGFYCKLGAIPDAGGICVPNPGSGSASGAIPLGQ